MARRSKAKGVGETELTTMTTFDVVSNGGYAGGYWVSCTKVCRDIGNVEIPLKPRTESGESERKYAKNKWLVASAALSLCQRSSTRVEVSHEP